MNTLQDLFTRGKALLSHVPQPHLEAKVLLLKCASLSEVEFYSSPAISISRSAEKRFWRCVARRQAGVPLAHLTGFKEFWSLPFEISRGVFIPRPETELVVEKVLELASKKSPTLIVDIGTGAGNIALALALEMPKARILATDISRRALKIASRNARRAKAANVTFLEGHLFSPLKKISGLTKPDFVVSNPPYVAQEDWPRLPLEILRYEPKRALFAGKTGLEVIHPLIKGAARFLKPGGYLVMEIGQGQQQRILSLFDSRWMEVQAGLDLAGISRVIVARKA